MKCVILGATGRLGRHVVSACVAAGDEVVAVTRGAASPGAHPVVRWATLTRRTSGAIIDYSHRPTPWWTRETNAMTIGVDTRP